MTTDPKNQKIQDEELTDEQAEHVAGSTSDEPIDDTDRTPDYGPGGSRKFGVPGA